MKNFILLLLLVFIACEKQNIEQFIKVEGKEISLEYNVFQIKKLKDNDYINIDNVKYTHFSNLDKTKNILPSYENIILNIEGKELKQMGNIVSISNSLLDNLRKTKNYQFKKPQLNTLSGKIIFKRKDDKLITIIFPKDYPVLIKEIK
jgi:hypothetical protein|tara:strand:- start:541 stop:984 length:444 start_codon:yes stop_codon:yes gene_type:complete